MPDRVNKIPVAYRSRKGVLKARWHGSLAFTSGYPDDPYNCPKLGPVLAVIPQNIAKLLALEFSYGYKSAATQMRELSLENPYTYERNGRRVRIPLPENLPPAPDTATTPHIIRAMRWAGLLAYIKGIDGSPAHDVPTYRRIKRHPNDLAIQLIRAWEQGYDDAHERARELSLERTSIIEQPRIYDARHIRVASPRDHQNKKD